MSGNAKLTLIVDGTLSVYGGAAGNGSNGAAGDGTRVPGGTSGYAGIDVPRGTTLTVRGIGTLSAYGGHAGNGGIGGGGNAPGAGGGGAGAGIGGNGGIGGQSGRGNWTNKTLDDGESGKAGVSAGVISIYEKVQVYAYGGAGGSGGYYRNSAPAGGGGYPGAGIGGGGAGGGGGSHGPAGGGFSGGRGEADTTGTMNVDGLGAPASEHGPGGGYFSAANGSHDPLVQPGLGGGGYQYATAYVGTGGGSGGKAGDGGEVQKSNTATLDARNGSYKTVTKQWGVTPTPIYAQSGYSLDKLREVGVRTVDAGLTANGVRSKAALEAELGTKGKTLIPTGLAGVGSGAGYTESSIICLCVRGRRYLPPGPGVIVRGSS